MELELIPARPEHADSFLRWRAQAATLRHNPLRAVTRAEVERQLLDEGAALTELGRRDAFRWFVRLGEALVGNVSMRVNTLMGFAEIAYGVDEAFHGRGIGTAAVRLLVDKAFSETTLRRLVAFVHDENLPSLKLLDRLGFAREGVLREHYVIRGQPANEVVFGLLRREWQARRAGP